MNNILTHNRHACDLWSIAEAEVCYVAHTIRHINEDYNVKYFMKQNVHLT